MTQHHDATHPRASRPDSPQHPPSAQAAGEPVQHSSGDLRHAEDAPGPTEAPIDAPQPLDVGLDESLPSDAVDEAEEKWWASDADAEGV